MKAIKTLGMILTVAGVMLAVGDLAFAQNPPVEKTVVTTPVVSTLPTFPTKAIGAGMVIIGAAIGFGRIGGSALESMARQPEVAGKVQTAMIIIGALLEGATFFALIVCMQG